jgi:hypothetical protein
MKLLKNLPIVLFVIIGSVAFVQSINLLKPNDPRVIAEHYSIGNGKSITISNYPPVKTAKGTEYLKSRLNKKKRHETTEKMEYPSFNKINKQEDMNYCIGGEDETDLKSRLQKFSDGTCLPVVLAPGYLLFYL